MNRKRSKPSWRMTTRELRKATAEFDKEFVVGFGPMTPEAEAQWNRAKRKRSRRRTHRRDV